MTLLLLLKPNLDANPSPVPGGDTGAARKKFRDKLRRKQQRREEEDLIALLRALDDEDPN